MSESRIEDDIDAQARRIASDACRGAIDEHTARMQIMELIVGAKIAQFVADRSPAETWEKDEVADRVHDNMIHRVLDEGGLDLEIASRSSVLGWARQEGFRKATWSLGEIRRENRRLTSVGDGNLDDELIAAEPERDEASFDSDEFMDLADGFVERAKGTRERGRSIIAARTLLDAFRLPNPVAPSSRLDRDWIDRSISADHGIAHRALGAFVRLIDGTMSDEDRSIDERLLALWDDYSYEQADTLLARPPLVVRTIVAATVARRPRPNKGIISEVVDIALLAGQGEGWDEFALDAVETWLALECEPFSEFTSPSADQVRKARQIAAERSSRWETLVADSARYGSPFGSSPEEAAEWIASVFDSIVSYPLSL